MNSLIQQLIQPGNLPHPDLLADILTCGDAAVEPLIAIISNQKVYWYDAQGWPRWLPSYAIGLLGDLRAKAAIPVLVELLRRQGTGDLCDQVVDALVRIGPAAVKPLKAVVLDRSLGWPPRSHAIRALVGLIHRGMKDSETLLEFLQSLLVHGPANHPDDRSVYAFLAHDLADLQGMDAVETIRAAFQRDAIDPVYIDWPDAETMCQNASPDLLRRYTVDFLSDYRTKFHRRRD
ncbi:MAG: DUF1186 domain-containing protein [Chloroflexi bacterium]|nr:DUF1186 domain-containing protein [Chloroflexota bacterium]